MSETSERPWDTSENVHESLYQWVKAEFAKLRAELGVKPADEPAPAPEPPVVEPAPEPTPEPPVVEPVADPTPTPEPPPPTE